MSNTGYQLKRAAGTGLLGDGARAEVRGRQREALGGLHWAGRPATLAYVRTLEDGIPQSWEHVHYTRPEVDQAEAVITWHGDLIRSYASRPPRRR